VIADQAALSSLRGRNAPFMTESASNPNRFYLTTPIYYVNARPHLGHAYTTIVCDAIARRKRALGIETWFLTGTDEHGQKIERSAKAAGCTPEEFATKLAGEFRGLWDRLGLTYDDFIRTTEPRHIRGVQHLFATLRDRGYIYKGSYTGQYCIGCEEWIEGPPGTVCPIHGIVTETVSEENYFFKLSAFERKLLEFYEANPEFMGPESTRREVVSFVRSGLSDVSVSRTTITWGIPVPGDEQHVIYVWFDALANYITALGYGSDDPKDKARFEKFWPADVHLIGKEISRFHCVYWPAFLMAAGIAPPRSVRANGWLLFDQGKMSKSRGNIVRAETVQDVLGADALRYFLLREIPFGQDGNFSFDALVQRYNGDLANGYGNLVSRVVNMVHKYFGGVVPEVDELDETLIPPSISALTLLCAYFDNYQFSECLKQFNIFVAAIDQYLTVNAPWKKPADRGDEDHKKLQERVLVNAAEAIRIITALAYPILPEATAKVWRQLGLGEIVDAFRQYQKIEQSSPLQVDRPPTPEEALFFGIIRSRIEAGTKFGEPAPLFPRAEKDAIERMQNLEDENNRSAVEAAGGGSVVEEAKAPAPVKQETAEAPVKPALPQAAMATAKPVAPVAAKVEAPTALVAAAPVAPQAATEAAAQEPQHITIDDFVKVELRVAQILVAERVPKADKLLRLEVDLGTEKRQILAGIAEYYEPEKLIGRKIVIVANLAPRKMRGLESNGMLLAASLEGGAPVLAGFLEDVPLGARLK
jgi:methionyl-tRNA synthetase